MQDQATGEPHIAGCARIDLQLCHENGISVPQSLDMPIEIGRSPQAHVSLKSWRVAARHARIDWRGDACHLEDFGSLAGTQCNGRRVARHAVLRPGDEIIIGPCLMRILAVHPPSMPQADVRGGLPSPDPVADGNLMVSAAVIFPAALPQQDSSGQGHVDTDPTHEAWLSHGPRLHAALLDALDLRRRDVSYLSDASLRSEADALLGPLIAGDLHLPSGIDPLRLRKVLLDEAVGLGPLEPLLHDASITEIMVNRHDEIYVERHGCLSRHPGRFTSERAVLGVIERIVSPLGRRIDESAPLVDARLRDGARVNAVIPPIALRGASLTIRKFPAARPDMRTLLGYGTLDEAMGRFLAQCVRTRRNIVVSGGTGSGKTTLLNVLSNCIPAQERIVTIEDAAELRLAHAHLVALEARPPNLEGKGQVLIRDLVRNALRMRPDRIVVGECRGAEAFDMLSAMNTGHEGSLTTLHANSARDALSRLESMILMAGLDLPLVVVREQIASSVELIVQQTRLACGRRVIQSICEITGMESGRIQIQELFRYRGGSEPAFVGCGVMPERCPPTGFDAEQAMALFSQCTPVASGTHAAALSPDEASMANGLLREAS